MRQQQNDTDTVKDLELYVYNHLLDIFEVCGYIFLFLCFAYLAVKMY